MANYPFDNLNLDRFRGLRNLQIDGLGQFNVFVGANNSGKTSVLEAVSLLCNPFDPTEWLAMVRRRDFGRLDETRVQSLRWCFPQAKQLADSEAMFESECQMSCTGQVSLRRLRATYRDIVGEPAPRRSPHRQKPRRTAEFDVEMFGPRRGAEITHVVETDGAEHRTLFSAQALAELVPIVIQVWEDEPVSRGAFRGRRQVRCETLTPYSYQINRLQVQYQSKHMFDESRSATLDLIRAFDPEIQGIEIASVRGGRPALYLNHRRLGPSPLSVFGDALRRALLLASTLPTLRGGVLFIDEIEAGIHISLLQRIFAWLNEAANSLHVQIISTTHSLEAVDALLAGGGSATQDLVTFHIEQAEERTIAKRYDEDLLARLRNERGLDVR
jgi:energy-coupling factor transporter ATP-binding protein EcfA2